MDRTKLTGRGERGARAERLVAKHYETLGYTIVDRNWLCRGGELDLVLTGTDVIVFVEVRSVTTDFLDGAEISVTSQKQRRVSVAAELWLGQRPEFDGDVRFDVVAVRFRTLLPPVINRFENAFTPPWSI